MRVLLSFKSRQATLQCANMLKANGYPSRTADAPVSLYDSCTLCVYTTYDAFLFVSNYLRASSSFLGAYKTNELGGLTRIY